MNCKADLSASQSNRSSSSWLFRIILTEKAQLLLDYDAHDEYLAQAKSNLHSNMSPY
jgi:hypothetical protein